MSAPNLIMPMAGLGSRFQRDGIENPKPLLDLAGRPFFWWAVESVRRVVPLERMIFVILEEHRDRWSLDQCIREFYPAAHIIVISNVTSGSAETAAIGMSGVVGGGPVIVNDCDHAFIAPCLTHAIEDLETEHGYLLTFRANSPNYSYVRLDENEKIVGTVEKEVVSPFAIAGCYMFRSRELFEKQYGTYTDDCEYSELYLSGIYNQMLRNGLAVSKVIANQHLAFGTPEEYNRIRSSMPAELLDWR